MKEITSAERRQAPASKSLLFRATVLWVVQVVVVVSEYTKTIYGFENNNDTDIDTACKFAHQSQNSVSDPGKICNTDGQFPSQI